MSSAMRPMKHSGIPWIGEIPSGWGAGRIGGLYKHRNTKVNDADYPPLSVTMQGVVPQLETAAKTNDHENRKLVRVGDFAINSRSDRRGSCGISEYDGSVSLINTVLEPRSEMSPHYYSLLFHTSQFADEFYKWGHGIVDDLWTTRWTDMKAVRVPLPPLEEQRRIADFLDEQCGRIDEVRQTLADEIDALKRLRKATIHQAVTKGLDPAAPLKDTGIPWIGEIPSSWNSVPVFAGFACEDRKNNMLTRTNALKFFDGTIVSKPVTDLDEVMRRVFSSYQFADKYSLVINGLNLNYDFKSKRVGLVTTSGVITSAYLVIRPRLSIVVPRFVTYLLKGFDYQKVFHNMGTGIRKTLAWNEFKRLRITVPPLEEQRRIADFLDERCAAIDSIIDTRTKQLERLEGYRKALIFAYVTGKKEVPGHE